HIALDFWSLEILVDELCQLYAAFTTGTQAQLRALPLQYRDYVQWSIEAQAGAAGEKHWDYWRNKLYGAPMVLDLQTDRPRPAVQTDHGATSQCSFGEALTERLRALSKAQATTLYVVLQTAFQVLLWRYTGQEDILIGSPMAGRNRAELEGLVGHF